MARTGRDPYCSGSIVVAPIRLGGRVIARLKSSIGVVTGREDQVAITHERQAPGDGLLEHWRALCVTTIEGIVVVFSHEAAMHMHTVSRLVFHRFRHEAGGNAEAFRHRADTALHTNDLITVSERIIRVRDVDLILCRCRFFQYALKRQALQGKAVFECIE